MKRIISLALAAIMVVLCAVSFASCGKKADDGAADDTTKAAATGAKYKFGVQSGTTGWSFMSGDADWGFDGFANVDISSYDNASLAVKDMLAGNIDYVVIDADVGKALSAENAGTKVYDIALTTESYGIAVDKNQDELLSSINEILVDKKDDVDAIFAKYQDVNDDNASNWSGDVIPAGTYDSSKDQLVVATNAAFAPYEFTVGNGFAGIDMEIAKLIADTLDMELVISDMDFDAVASSVGKNGVDVGLAGMTINETRKKVVNFSDPYYTEAYQIIVAPEDDTLFSDCKTTDDVLAVLAGLETK